MEHARPPAELSLDGGPAMRSEAWRKWRKLFEVFLKASGVSKEPQEVQASLLVNLIGSAGYEVYTTFTFEKGESEADIDCVLKKFDKYFGAKSNITVRRFKFFSRSQEDGENMDLQRAVLDNERDLSLLPQPEATNSTITSVSSDSETQYDSPVARSSSEQSSPPAVTITRSRERTARMLKDYLFGRD